MQEICKGCDFNYVCKKDEKKLSICDSVKSESNQKKCIVCDKPLCKEAIEVGELCCSQYCDAKYSGIPMPYSGVAGYVIREKYQQLNEFKKESGLKETYEEEKDVNIAHSSSSELISIKLPELSKKSKEKFERIENEIING